MGGQGAGGGESEDSGRMGRPERVRAPPQVYEAGAAPPPAFLAAAARMEAKAPSKLAPALRPTIAKSGGRSGGSRGGDIDGGGSSLRGSSGGSKGCAVHAGWRTLEIVMPRHKLADDRLRCRGPNGYVYTVRRGTVALMTCLLTLTSGCPLDSLLPEPHLCS